jgi:hypothetical protein
LFAKEEFEPDTPNLFFFFRSRDCDDYCFDDKCCDPWGDRFHLFGKDDIILQTTVIDVTLLLYLTDWLRAASQMISSGHGPFIDSLIDDDRNLKFTRNLSASGMNWTNHYRS